MTIYAITGDSGTGKSSIVGSYLNSRGIKKLITNTTRPPKENEINGIHYRFGKLEDFDINNFIEYSQYAGYYYGTTEKDLRNLLQHCPNIYVILDKSGVRRFKEIYGDEVVTIKLSSSLMTMVQRLKARGDSEIEIYQRVQQWQKERNRVDLFKYDYHLNSDTDVVTEITRHVDRILEETMA